MKKTLLALAVLAISGSAMATNFGVSVPNVSTSGSSTVSGAISNSISASSMIKSGVGTSVSAAGSSASSTATTALTANKDVDVKYFIVPVGYTATSNIGATGSTDTSLSGYGWNVSTGTGEGAATAAGWSDAGAKASINTSIGNNGNNVLNLSGAVDTGHPTNVWYGPDLSIKVGTNQGSIASGVAGGTFDVSGKLYNEVNWVTGKTKGLVSDTKAVTTYATTAIGVVNGVAMNVAPLVLNAGSQANASANGQFKLENTTVGNN